jgi:diaminopimelate epimerase
MKEKIRFTKMHGCGNDYIYVNLMEHEISNPEAAAVAWSDRHKGIGSDGLVLIDRSHMPEADFSMRIFNADGSEAMMCGNASRCIGKYLYERGLTDQTEIRLLTLSGVKTLLLDVKDGTVENVTVDMLEPAFEDESLFMAHRGIDKGVFVSMGNPHFVIFTEHIDQVGETGRILEHYPAFPQRCNIEFAATLSSPEGDTMLPSVKTIEAPSGAVGGPSVFASGNVVAALPKPAGLVPAPPLLPPV